MSQLNNFSEYSQYSSYQSRTQQPDKILSKSVNEFTKPEIFKINQQIDQFTHKIDNLFLQEQQLIYQPQKQQISSDYNLSQTHKSIYVPEQNYRETFKNYKYPQETTRYSNMQEEFKEYIKFKQFIKAKEITFQNNLDLSDLYQFYLKNDVAQKVKQYQFLEANSSKIIIQK